MHSASRSSSSQPWHQHLHDDWPFNLSLRIEIDDIDIDMWVPKRKFTFFLTRGMKKKKKEKKNRNSQLLATFQIECNARPYLNWNISFAFWHQPECTARKVTVAINYEHLHRYHSAWGNITKLATFFPFFFLGKRCHMSTDQRNGHRENARGNITRDLGGLGNISKLCTPAWADFCEQPESTWWNGLFKIRVSQVQLLSYWTNYCPLKPYSGCTESEDRTHELYHSWGD